MGDVGLADNARKDGDTVADVEGGSSVGGVNGLAGTEVLPDHTVIKILLLFVKLCHLSD